WSARTEERRTRRGADRQRQGQLRQLWRAAGVHRVRVPVDAPMTNIALDLSQRAAATVAPSERQIVIAGPGSGKTEVVSHLVEHLVEDLGVDAAEGLVVLSFSNAAVFAADARLRARRAGPVDVQTVDSLAGE